jgi:ribonucleoside-triphosphate reductase
MVDVIDFVNKSVFKSMNRLVQEEQKIPVDTKKAIRNFLHLTKYARWIPSENRRETFEETIYRYLYFMYKFINTHYSKIHSRLETFGGYASGPEPLIELIDFITKTATDSVGRKLNSIECFDICCKIAEVVRCGGVRRSALITLFSANDEKMLNAKMGEYYINHPYRAMSNISITFDEEPTYDDFNNWWNTLKKSQTGEPGMFSEWACGNHARNNNKTYPRSLHPRFISKDVGTNPCSEAVFFTSKHTMDKGPMGFCNLTEVVCRPDDTLQDLLDKIEAATLLGTWQSCLTSFPVIDSTFNKNMTDQRLLGVSLTGICDCKLMVHHLIEADDETAKKFFTTLKNHAIHTNFKEAKRMGIEPSKAITCVKPSGTVSMLVDSSSGLHPRFWKYGVLRFYGERGTEIDDFLISSGLPYEKQKYGKENQIVFEFPMKAPEGALTVKDVDAMTQLKIWYRLAKWWCEHKPSVTVYLGEDDWDDAKEWLWENRELASGLAFLPKNDVVFPQMPFEETTPEEYERRVNTFPEIQWNLLHETEDHTTLGQEASCSGGLCDLQM